MNERLPPYDDFPDADEKPAPSPASIHRRIVLASASPYRRKLLTEAGVEFSVLASSVDEDLQPRGEPEAFALALALRKAQAVASRCRNALVIGADTVCAVGGEIVGKPRDEEDAVAMIRRACETGLQRVITGVAVIDSADMRAASGAVTSLVEMRAAPLEVIRAYVRGGEAMGKCGALCIEGNHQFVRRWEGSYSNIMGLPLEWLLPKLVEFGAMSE